MAAGVLVGSIGDDGTVPTIVGVVPTVSRGRVEEPALDLAKWGWVHSAIDRYYQGHRAIGWYLSRPGHQAQLDDGTLMLHRSYFPSGPAVLLLVDPRTGTAALHAGTGGALDMVQRLDAAPGSVAPTAAGPLDHVRAVSYMPVVCAVGVVCGVLLWLWAGLPGGTS